MKVNLSLAAILSTTAIASGVLFTSVGTAQPCSLSKYRASTEQANQVNWLSTPLAAALTIPGIALAVSLYVRGRSYQN
jgi:ABC-type spermidine/putrescine transport system permease subunit II